MRIVGWVAGGALLGIVTGLAVGLLRRQPIPPPGPVAEPRAAYAGGYAAPKPSADYSARAATPAALRDRPAVAVWRTAGDETSRTTPDG